MSVVYVGILSHAPGITGRAHLATNELVRDQFYDCLRRQAEEIKQSGAEVLIVIAAEHFANFFMDNMPAYCMGVGEKHSGPIEDSEWLKIDKTSIPGSPVVAHKILKSVMQSIDLAYSEEWQCDHGIMVPLHFLTPNYDMPVIPCNINCQGPPLTPLSRVWQFGQALRQACDEQDEKIAIVGTGGISHWPATPDSGKINEEWDREFLSHLMQQNKEKLLSYVDEEIYRDAGQGGFEIRTLIAAAAAAGGQGELQFYSAELPIFAVGCTVANFDVSN
jgi:2,3-dihydroxyphenylpropionate 1,2-dioxygenase|tara:strand:+ start:6637 stop:7464 length:828 start_codon:yes stop_codon:yes gene_type:complete